MSMRLHACDDPRMDLFISDNHPVTPFPLAPFSRCRDGNRPSGDGERERDDDYITRFGISNCTYTGYIIVSPVWHATHPSPLKLPSMKPLYPPNLMA